MFVKSLFPGQTVPTVASYGWLDGWLWYKLKLFKGTCAFVREQLHERYSISQAEKIFSHWGNSHQRPFFCRKPQGHHPPWLGNARAVKRADHLISKSLMFPDAACSQRVLFLLFALDCSFCCNRKSMKNTRANSPQLESGLKIFSILLIGAWCRVVQAEGRPNGLDDCINHSMKTRTS